MRFPLLGRWEDAETGDVLVERLFLAKTYWQRLRGLQFLRRLAPDSGLLFRNCRSVHTMWMRFAIDLVFLSEDGQILEIRTDVKPWRVVVCKDKNVSDVIEVASGLAGEWTIDGNTRIVECQGSARPNSERAGENEAHA